MPGPPSLPPSITSLSLNAFTPAIRRLKCRSWPWSLTVKIVVVAIPQHVHSPRCNPIPVDDVSYNNNINSATAFGDRPVDSVSSKTPGNLIRPSRATLTLEKNRLLPPCVPWKFLFLPPNRPLHQWIYFWGHPCCRCLPEGDTHSLGSSVVTGEAGPTLVSALVSPFVRLL